MFGTVTKDNQLEEEAKKSDAGAILNLPDNFEHVDLEMAGATGSSDVHHSSGSASQRAIVHLKQASQATKVEDDDLDEKPERMKDVDYWTMEANVHQDSLSLPRKSTSSPDKLPLANITPSNEQLYGRVAPKKKKEDPHRPMNIKDRELMQRAKAKELKKFTEAYDVKMREFQEKRHLMDPILIKLWNLAGQPDPHPALESTNG